MKKIILVIVGALLLCSGCGNKETSDYVIDAGTGYDGYETTGAQGYDMEADAGEGLNDVYSTYEMDEAYSETDSAAEENASNTEGVVPVSGDKAGTLNREMLVYRGVLSIDTLDFNTSVSDFKSLVNEKGGFVESESYSDSYSTGGYYAVDDANKHNVYYATVRIPSAEYDVIMNSATNLGDVRNRSSNVSNVTQQYGTYTMQLEVYEAEYERYLTLLENATEDEYALQIENELFDIQLRIAELESGIANIENDVAYSYIDITIKEVLKYEEKLAPSDTFLNRFKNTCRESWHGFLEAMEDILFWIVMNIYGIVILLVIVVVICIVLRKRKAKRNGKVRAEMNDPAVNTFGQTSSPASNTEEQKTEADHEEQK